MPTDMLLMSNWNSIREHLVADTIIQPSSHYQHFREALTIAINSYASFFNFTASVINHGLNFLQRGQMAIEKVSCEIPLTNNLGCNKITSISRIPRVSWPSTGHLWMDLGTGTGLATQSTPRTPIQAT